MQVECKGFTNSCRPTAVSPDSLARLSRRSEMYPFIVADVMDAAVPTEAWVLQVVQSDVGGGLGISTSVRAVRRIDLSLDLIRNHVNNVRSSLRLIASVFIFPCVITYLC